MRRSPPGISPASAYLSWCRLGRHAKNELTNAVSLALSYDANGNLTNRGYDATGPKSYVYLYDDENQLIQVRTDTSATPTGSRWRTTWAYDGV